MEGILTVPPDRGSIIGRAQWKSRYVTIQRRQPSNKQNGAQSASITGRMRGSIGNILTDHNVDGTMVLSVYKSSHDHEAVLQLDLSRITECSIQTVAHRKQGSVQPTMIISMTADQASDKLRKRRSSRTGGLTQSKDSSSMSLWFRQVSADERPTLQEWSRYIQSALQSELSGRPPMSPLSPMSSASPSFRNPFANDSHASRPRSSNQRPPLQHKASAQTSSSKERPLTYSESLSLKSKRSDISSRTGSMTTPYNGYANMMPSDLPSPAPTMSDYRGGLIEGWTSAQGRSSALGSPRESPMARRMPMSPAHTEASSPPHPRETILDRAFSMRYIPGSESTIPGEEKLSSLARFDALMREADEKRRTRGERERAPATALPRSADGNDGLKSVWEADDSSDEEGNEDNDENSESHYQQALGDLILEEPFEDAAMDTEALRALDYVSVQTRSPQPGGSLRSHRSPLDYNAESLMALSSGSSPRRPKTSHARQKPPMRVNTAPPEKMLQSRTVVELPEVDDIRRSNSTLQRVASSDVKRHSSSSSTKRLSFNDFTKRLSSTSSLLLVQGTNYDKEPEGQLSAGSSRHHSKSPLPMAEREAQKCSWRASVGVFGSGDGGFL